MTQSIYFSHIKIYWLEVNLFQLHRAAKFNVETTMLQRKKHNTTFYFLV